MRTERLFTAKAAFGPVYEGAFFWTDEGHGSDDAIHFYAFEWIDQPDSVDMKRLMNDTSLTVENYITAGKGYSEVSRNYGEKQQNEIRKRS